jgi:hypothetical protein
MKMRGVASAIAAPIVIAVAIIALLVWWLVA